MCSSVPKCSEEGRTSSSFNYYRRMAKPSTLPSSLISRNLDHFPQIHFIWPALSSMRHKRVMLLMKLLWVQKHFFANTRFNYLLATTIYSKDFDVRVLGKEHIFPKIFTDFNFFNGYEFSYLLKNQLTK